MVATTRLGAHGGPRSLYGSFAGKTPFVPTSTLTGGMGGGWDDKERTKKTERKLKSREDIRNELEELFYGKKEEAREAAESAIVEIAKVQPAEYAPPKVKEAVEIVDVLELETVNEANQIKAMTNELLKDFEAFAVVVEAKEARKRRQARDERDLAAIMLLI